MDLTAAVSDFQQAKAIAAVQMKGRAGAGRAGTSGAAAVKLIEAAGQTAAGAGDTLVAAATGLGGSIDTYG